MAEISAATVMKLRKMSGQGMMDCKKALTEADGDLEKAMGLLRKKGLATLAKRAGRETSQGLVVAKTSDDGKEAVLVSLCSETDFVAKSENFGTIAAILADYAMACSADEGTENILETAVNGRKFSDVLTELVSQTGEKTKVGDYAKYKLNRPGLVSQYIHFNRKIGTMIQVETSDDNVAANEALRQTINDVAMHVAAINPLALDKDGISPEMIESEKAIYAEQVKNKPINIIDKIIEGKLNKFFADKCLTAQAFVKDDSKTVEQVVTDAAKAGGGQAKITRFVRFSVES